MKQKQFLLSFLLIVVVGLFFIDIVSLFFKKIPLSSRHSSIKLNTSFLSGGGSPVALLKLEGPISDETVQPLLVQLKQISHNSSIKGILLKINSPGGTTGASEEVYNEVMKLRKKGITIVTSVGDLAASGGFYIASASNIIVAKASSLTGSIGVIISTMNFKGLADKYGVKMVNLTSGKMKDMLSPFRDMREDEKAYIHHMIMEIYDQFVNDVFIGRHHKISKKLLLQIADGRVFTGKDAKEYGLIDVLGGFSTAVDEMKKSLHSSKIKLIPFAGNRWEQIVSKIVSKNQVQPIGLDVRSIFLKSHINVPLYYVPSYSSGGF